ncbi:hypothetical protein AAFP35_08250 [Gordonia sp. CPCC 206044]|uniref:hypothetical protein n=1 Tax=Gordonia sp. CPCC 206044 TaxID=3140793 RepID=UPI003AF3709E
MDSDDLLYIWSGSAWPADGSGLELQGAEGPQGPQGEPGAPGTTSWSDLVDKPVSFTPSAHTHAAADITSGTLDSTRVPNLDAGKITTGTLGINRVPTGTTSSTVCIGNDARLSDARTPTAHTHSAADITSGTLAAAQVPNLDATKIATGTLDAARIPPVTSAMITNGTIVNADISTSAGIQLSKLSTTGTASSSTYLRGDGAWSSAPVPAASGGYIRRTAAQAVATGTDTMVYFTSTAWAFGGTARGGLSTAGLEIGEAGIYMVEAVWPWATNSVNRRNIKITLNNANINSTIAQQDVLATPWDNVSRVTTIVPLAAGDILYVFVAQDCGSNLNGGLALKGLEEGRLVATRISAAA